VCWGPDSRSERNKILVSESLVTYVRSMVFIYFCSNSNIVEDLASPAVVCVWKERAFVLLQCLVSEVAFVLWRDHDTKLITVWNERNDDRVSWNHYLQFLDEQCCKIWGSKHWCWWRAKSSRILCHFALWIATDVLEECAASIFRVQQSVKTWPARHGIIPEDLDLQHYLVVVWSSWPGCTFFSMITLLLI